MTTEAWDPSLQSFETPFDGRIISAIGGATGKITLLNGKQITFPWKRQQETTGTYPGTIHVYDDAAKEFMELNGPTIVAAASRARVYLAGWSDATSSLGLEAGGAKLYLASGIVYVDGGPFRVDGGTITGNVVNSTTTMGAGGNITTTANVVANLIIQGGTVTSLGGLNAAGLADLNGGIDVTGGVVSLVAGGINSVVITSGDDVTISASGSAGTASITASGTGTASLVAATGGTAAVQGGAVQVVSTLSTLILQSATTASLTGGTDVAVASGSGGYIFLNNGNERSVMVNSYPALALRDRHNAALGTPPAVTAAITGFKVQSGRRSVTFTAGAGTLIFLSSFSTGVVNVVACAESNDAVIAVNPGGGVTVAQIALTCFIGGVAATGDVTVSYFALGW